MKGQYIMQIDIACDCIVDSVEIFDFPDPENI